MERRRSEILNEMFHGFVPVFTGRWQIDETFHRRSCFEWHGIFKLRSKIRANVDTPYVRGITVNAIVFLRVMRKKRKRAEYFEAETFLHRPSIPCGRRLLLNYGNKLSCHENPDFTSRDAEKPRKSETKNVE